MQLLPYQNAGNCSEAGGKKWKHGWICGLYVHMYTAMFIIEHSSIHVNRRVYEYSG